MTTVRVDAGEAAPSALRPLVGQTLLAVIDGGWATELVFDGDQLNLLTIYPDGRVSVGGVSDPGDYASRA